MDFRDVTTLRFCERLSLRQKGLLLSAHWRYELRLNGSAPPIESRQAVGKIWRSHDALADPLPAYEREHRLYHVRCIEHLVMTEPLCREEASTAPVASVQLAVAPRYFVVIEVVHDQTGLS